MDSHWNFQHCDGLRTGKLIPCPEAKAMIALTAAMLEPLARIKSFASWRPREMYSIQMAKGKRRYRDLLKEGGRGGFLSNFENRRDDSSGGRDSRGRCG